MEHRQVSPPTRQTSPDIREEGEAMTSSPDSSIAKMDYVHHENSIHARDHAHAITPAAHHDHYAHFKPQENQTAPKFIQLEQGAKNDSPLARTVPKNLWTPLKAKWWIREGLAEFFGTMIMIIFGDGVVAQVVLSGGEKGSYQSISWCWGIGVMFGVYIAGGISGGHLNPAVTLTNCVLRKLSWKKLPVYWFCQTAGCFMGAAIVYGNYRSAIQAYEGGDMRTVGLTTSTAGIFCTYPAAFMTRTGMVFSEFVASTVLMFAIFAIGDPNNNPAGDKGPLILFFLIFGIGAALGWETGYAINFARDFGPRLFTSMAGYGSGVWTAGGYYFWIPMVIPFLGCLTGGTLYDLFIYTGPSPLNAHKFGLAGWRDEDWHVEEGITAERRRQESLATLETQPTFVEDRKQF